MMRFYFLGAIALSVLGLSAREVDSQRMCVESSQQPSVEELVNQSKNELRVKSQMYKAESAESEDVDWQDLGLCAYTDDLVTTCWSVGTQTYNVRVQQDKNHPGMYRIVNPWENYPKSARQQVENHEDNPGILPVGDEYYILFDATDPDAVKVKESPIGIRDNSKGLYTAYGLSELVGQYGVTQSKADAAVGKLVDGVIKFDYTYAVYLISCDDNGKKDWWLGNKNKGLQLVLTGTSVPVDYDFKLVVKDDYCPSNSGNYQFQVLGDENIPALRFAVVEEWPSFPVAIQEVIEKGKNISPNQVVVVNTDNMPSRCAHVLIIAADAEGQIQTTASFEVFNHGFEASEWEPFGKGLMTEGFLSALYPTIFDPLEFEVDIQKHKTREGCYRIVNPYDNYAPAAQYLTYGHSHDHHLYINATDPENVYFERSTIGIEMISGGEMYLDSEWSNLLWMWGSDDYEADKDFINGYYGIEGSGSHFENGVLTFNESSGIFLSAARGGQYYTNVMENPEYDAADAAAAKEAGEPYDIKPFLPGNFKLKFYELAGVEDVAVDENGGAVEYYNLQGVKVDNPEKGLYIKRQGGKAAKVIL